MGEKDILQKTLEGYNDVFADIANAFLFEGEKVIQAADLEAATPDSIYKIQNETHMQIRDVAKFWKDGEIRIAMCGFENQTKPDWDMPFRVIGYDGAAYTAQLRKDAAGRFRPERYPIITLVLYFGRQPWCAPQTLFGAFSREVPPQLKPYVNDYRIHVIEIAHLTPEALQKLTSDFHAVAEFCIHRDNPDEYCPTFRTFEHPDEVIDLLDVMSGDIAFKHMKQERLALPEKGALPIMSSCALIEYWKEVGRKQVGELYRQNMLKQGRAEGLEKGLAEGREKGLAEGREKGLAEGREKGLAEGREKGLAEGREKGLAEGREKGLEQALLIFRLFNQGADLAAIAEQTGESEESIQKMLIDSGFLTEA